MLYVSAPTALSQKIPYCMSHHSLLRIDLECRTIEVRWMKIQHRLDSYRPSLIGCHSMFFVLVLILWVSQGDPSGAIGHSQSTCSCRSGLGFQNNELRPRRTDICPTCIFHSHSHGIPRRLPLAMQLQKKTNPHEFNCSDGRLGRVWSHVRFIIGPNFTLKFLKTSRGIHWC